MHLSTLERKILNCIQEDIPLQPQPFRILSKQLGIEEEEFLQRIRQLKAKGVVRRFSAGINHKKLGFKSSLIALKVPLYKLNSITKKIIIHPEVTHCFLRKNEYNLWMILIYKNGMLKTFLDRLAKDIGRENVLNLPTKRQFKLKTKIKV